MGIFSRKSSPSIGGVFTPLFIPIADAKYYLSSGLSANEQKFFNYYLCVPELQSVINYRAKCLSSMKVKLRKIDGEDVEKHPILTLLQQPNVLQSFGEFTKQFFIYKDICGNGYIYPYFGTTIEKTKAMWNVPPIDAEVLINKGVDILRATSYDEIIAGYKFKLNAMEVTIPPEEIIHFTDTILHGVGKLDLKGKSKIQPLTQTLENIKTSYESRGQILGNSPLGMITNDTQDANGTIPLKPDQKKEVQDALREYGTTEGKYSYFITSARLKWQSMNITVTEQHFKEVTEDLRTVCNAFTFPPDLLLANSTYENIKEAKKQLYQDSIIPEANDWLQGLSSAFNLIDAGMELYADYSHIAALQADYEKTTRMWNTATMAIDKSIANGSMTVQEGRLLLEKIGML